MGMGPLSVEDSLVLSSVAALIPGIYGMNRIMGMSPSQ